MKTKKLSLFIFTTVLFIGISTLQLQAQNVENENATEEISQQENPSSNLQDESAVLNDTLKKQPKKSFKKQSEAIDIEEEKEKIEEKVKEEVQEYPWLKLVFWGSLLFCIVCYVVAHKKVKNGELTVIANYWDLLLLATPYISWILLYCFSFLLTTVDNPNVIIIIVGIVIPILGILGSFYYSIIYNKGSIGHILLSIVTKIIVEMILVVGVFALLNVFTKDKNGKSDTMTKIIFAAIAAACTWLIYSLIADNRPEIEEEVSDYKEINRLED